MGVSSEHRFALYSLTSFVHNRIFVSIIVCLKSFMIFICGSVFDHTSAD